MIRSALRPVALALVALFAGAAVQAAPFTVSAFGNSSTGGTGLATLSLIAGQSFSVSVGSDDLWSAGALPRWSNADGLTGNRFATGSDESGESIGTLIGADFGLYAQGNLSAAYGTLVGQIGAGDYFVVGTSFNGVAAATGTLNLFYWDSNFGDNTGAISADVTAVPEPETYALMLAGLGVVGFVARRRRPV
jgi:hypothetical protein